MRTIGVRLCRMQHPRLPKHSLPRRREFFSTRPKDIVYKVFVLFLFARLIFKSYPMSDLQLLDHQRSYRLH